MVYHTILYGTLWHSMVSFFFLSQQDDFKLVLLPYVVLMKKFELVIPRWLEDRRIGGMQDGLD